MMFGLMRVRTHDAEMAKVRAEQRTTGAALREALDQRDLWKKQALAAEAAAFDAPPNRWGSWDVRHG